MHILLHHVYAYARTHKHKHHHTKSTVMPLLCKVQYELGKTSPHKFHGYALVLFRALPSLGRRDTFNRACVAKLGRRSNFSLFCVDVRGQ